MPEEKSKMHQLLKAYAKKRQDEAAPLEMHPATRKILQGEVARVFGKNPTPEPAKKSAWFSLFWPRFALAACIAVVVGVLIFSQSRNEQRMELVQNKPVKSPEEFPAKPANDLSESRSFARTEPVEKSSEPKGTILPQAEEPIVSNDLLAMKKTEAARPHALATPESAPAPAERVSSAAPAAASAVAEGKTRSLTFEDLSKLKRNRVQGPTRFKFIQENNRAKYRQNLQSPPQQTVLGSFEIALAGNHVEITDADGSIYRGEIVEAPAQDKDLPQKRLETAERKIDGHFANRAPGSVQFRVTGTNKELQQIVVFTGTLRTNDFSNHFAMDGTNKSETNSLYSESSGVTGKTTNAVISGTAVIGGRNEFQLRATQIAP